MYANYYITGVYDYDVVRFQQFIIIRRYFNISMFLDSSGSCCNIYICPADVDTT